MKKAMIFLFAAGALMVASNAFAQVNVMGTPTYGTYTLNSGFTPDPASYSVTAGGPEQSATLAQGDGTPCNAGYIAGTPDVRIHYAAPTGLPLVFYVDTAGTDPTLAVNAPDGAWHCVDDWNSLQPRLQFDSPMAGQYDVFVGTFSEGQYPTVTLYVSEIASNGPAN